LHYLAKDGSDGDDSNGDGQGNDDNDGVLTATITTLQKMMDDGYDDDG